ncbi:MAG: hypothetical protein JKY52_09355 [Flavobacteriales bacterium]|nr:hypothetical protein [Flavobacteriales bacterium]
MSQDILDKIKALNTTTDLPETTDEVIEAVDVSDDDTLSDEVDVDEVEELETEEEVEAVATDDVEESYFDINGVETSLSQILEWQQGNLRQSDYTKKTTNVAEKDKALDAKSLQLDAALTSLNEKVATLDGLISEEEASIDWDELADEDASEYLKQRRKLDAKKAKLVTAKAQQKEQFNAKLAEESNILIGKIPAWSDPQVRDSEFKAALEYASSIGMDLTGVSDHRVYLSLVQASKFNAIDSKKALTAKKVRKAPKAVKAVKGRAKAKPTEMQDAKARLRKSGSKSDALAAIKQLSSR